MEITDIVYTVVLFLKPLDVVKFMSVSKTFQVACCILVKERIRNSPFLERLVRYSDKFKISNKNDGRVGLTENETKFFVYMEDSILMKYEEQKNTETTKNESESKFDFEEATKVYKSFRSNYGVVKLHFFKVNPLFKTFKILPDKIHLLGVLGMFSKTFDRKDIIGIENRHFFPKDGSVAEKKYVSSYNGDIVHLDRISFGKVESSLHKKHDIFYKCRDPPYGNMGKDSKKDVAYFRKEVFGNYENVEILDWCKDLEEGFDETIWTESLKAGLEWWGVYCYTYFVPEKEILVVTFASETD